MPGRLRRIAAPLDEARSARRADGTTFAPRGAPTRNEGRSVGVGFGPHADDRGDGERDQPDPDQRTAAAGEQLVRGNHHQHQQADGGEEDGARHIGEGRDRELVRAVALPAGEADRREKPDPQRGDEGDDRDVSECAHHFWVMTIIPIVTAAAAAASAITPRIPNASAATGRPSRLMSANRAAPTMASEKMNVTPTPATNAAAIVLSRASVSTTVASIGSAHHPAGTGAPWRIRRANAATTSASPIAVTIAGPSAPVPKI